MALWTPYSDEALDLSKVTVKKERMSPVRDFVPEYHFSPNPVPLEAVPPYYPVSMYPEQSVPTAQISPDSAGSAWSPSYRKNTASPPESMDSFEVDSLSDDVEYQAFERDALRAMAEKNGGALLGNNPRMRRAVQTTQAADDSYRKQRERNNYAAKQSRDRRKLREVRLAFQVTFLKKKLADLRTRLGDRMCVRCKYQC
ncbi:uncharacterized protein [Epargyreus clarus]|uniref:uncharacterized protein n=1 Tax=Epargyreus clarus TaxID=520877 RepID=UPI003C2DB3D5